MGPTVCLFRNNLRIADNLALTAAAAEGGSVVPVFVLDDVMPGRRGIGRAARWWLHRSLHSLAASLESAGSKLVLLKGETAASACELLEECGASSLHMQREYAPWDRALESRLRSMCKKLGIELRVHEDCILFPPEDVANTQGGFFRVFTPFWKHCLSLPPPDKPLPAPRSLGSPPQFSCGLTLDKLALVPRSGEWMRGLAKQWAPGEATAANLLEKFLVAGAKDYGSRRDFPGLEEGTSRLSPHIRFGEIGLRTLWHGLSSMADRERAGGGSSEFLRQVGWREFSYHLLHHFPKLPLEEFNPAYKQFPWSRAGKETMQRWSSGQTGYPFVDAGMRELRQTGWMHNRVRMVVASFLTKNLLVNWRVGADWFWDSLVDADIANNFAGWQWVAGCGADAAPYFRVFNPVLQGKKFDPEGNYIKKFVPELSGLDGSQVHEPWKVGVKGYPEPMVSLSATRQRALDAHRKMKMGKGKPPEAGNTAAT